MSNFFIDKKFKIKCLRPPSPKTLILLKRLFNDVMVRYCCVRIHITVLETNFATKQHLSFVSYLLF